MHFLAHIFKLNYGRHYVWTDGETGRIMIGFRCSGCGNIYGIFEAPEHLQ